jgi:hypothetical protein
MPAFSSAIKGLSLHELFVAACKEIHILIEEKPFGLLMFYGFAENKCLRGQSIYSVYLYTG